MQKQSLPKRRYLWRCVQSFQMSMRNWLRGLKSTNYTLMKCMASVTHTTGTNMFRRHWWMHEVHWHRPWVSKRGNLYKYSRQLHVCEIISWYLIGFNKLKLSLRCQCQYEFSGLHCTLSSNNCSTSSSAELCGYGTCIPTRIAGRSYTCLCDQVK